MKRDEKENGNDFDLNGAKTNEKRGTAAEKSRVWTRFVDRTVPLAPLSSAAQVSDWSAFPATLALCRPGNPTAAAIRRRIFERGGRVVALSLFAANGTALDEAVLREKVQTATRKFRCFNVLILTSFDSNRPFEFSKSDCERLARTAENVAIALQEWYRFVQAEGAASRAQVLAATRMGGSLGLTGPLDFPEDGAALGLVRGLKFETRTAPGGSTFDAFAVDHSPDESPNVVAENLLDELFSDADARRGRKVDVARRGRRRRYGLRVVEEAAGADERAATTKIARAVAASELGARTERSASVARRRADAAASVGNGERPVWLATGGARGVVAELALELGKRFGAKLYLIGSTRLDGDPSWADLDADDVKEPRALVVRDALKKKKKPAEIRARTEKKIEIFRNFRRLRDAGVEFEYFAQDLREYDETKKLVERLRDREPKITGVLFGAGFESASLFEKKTVESVRRTIGAKLTGAVPILDALRTSAPRFVVGMGSVAGRFGARGQADSSLANNALGKLLTGFAIRRVDCRSILFHWSPWADVGTAARPESAFAPRAAGITPAPIAEAIEAFFDELSARNVEREVCLTQREYCRRVCADDAGNAPIRDANANGAAAFEETLKKSGALSGALGETLKTSEKSPNETRDFAPKTKTRTEIELELAAGTALVVGMNADARALRRKIAKETKKNPPKKSKTLRVWITRPRDPELANFDEKTNFVQNLRIAERREIVRDVARRVDALRRERVGDGALEIVVLGNETPKNPLKYDEAELLRRELERSETEKNDPRTRVVVRRFPNDALPERLADAIWNEFGASPKTRVFVPKKASASRFVAKKAKRAPRAEAN